MLCMSYVICIFNTYTLYEPYYELACVIHDFVRRFLVASGSDLFSSAFQNGVPFQKFSDDKG